MEWLSVSGSEPDRRALARAADVLRTGGVVIYPTDTLYGIAADPRLPSAVERVFAVKGRSAGQPLPLIAGSREQAERVAALTGGARLLVDRFWPGPLTLLADARCDLAEGVSGDDGSIAVRVPDHAVARALADALGFAITSTSANRSGGRPSTRADEASADLADCVDLVLDAGPTPGGSPSTIVDARVDPPRLVRAGAVPFDVILEALTGS